jgi:hypothetical protein
MVGPTSSHSTPPPPPPEHGGALAPSEAIRAWQEQAMSATGLMRNVVAFDRWELPITERSWQAMRTTNAPPEPWLYRDASNRPRLFLFSSRQAYRRYHEAARIAKEQPFTATSGVSIFTRDLSALESVHLDPLTADTLTLGRDLFPRLNVVADAVRVERSLVQLRGGATRVAHQLSAVRNFAAYHVAFRDTPEGARFAIAPDPRSRYLAAVFTLNDCYEAFAREVGAATFKHGILTGEQLFTELLDAGLDGIVFNCCGPVPPVAFAPAFARLVLEAR